MASANSNQTIVAAPTETIIFDSTSGGPDATDGPCSEFLVAIRTGSAFPLLVRVEGLHTATEFVGIPAGAFITFEDKKFDETLNQIEKVTVKGDGGSATGVDWGVLGRKNIIRT